MILHVLKHPDPHNLAVCHETTETAPVPPGWEAMTVAAYEAWRDAEIAGGWAPPPAPPVQKTDAEIYAEHLALGFTDPVTGIKLKTTEGAQAKFTSQATLLQVALGAGAITVASNTQVWDFNDSPHTLTVGAALGLLLRYGLHCQQLFADYGP
jgi:hypothetical protein